MRRAARLFLWLLLGIAISLGSVSVLLYRVEVRSLTSSLADEERRAVARMQSAIGDVFDIIVGDLLFLTEQNELQALFAGSPDARPAIAQEYLALARHRQIYDQIRFLDESGQEQVRINFNSGLPSVVPDDALQDKGQRYYFRDVIALRPGEIFVSPFDLNIEQDAIEMPLKPMIRIGTPVVDAQGGKRGILLLNYLGTNLLTQLMGIDEQSPGQAMLLNADGFWLLAPSPEDAWGFMLPERAKRGFGNLFPDEWARIRTEKAGQLHTDNGLFTFVTLWPLDEAFRSSTGARGAYEPSQRQLPANAYAWVAASHIPAATLDGLTDVARRRVLVLGTSTFLVLAVGAWLLALAVVRWRDYQARLFTLAHHDSLTGLANRNLFFDRLRFIHDNAERYQRCYGLLYLDLNGFKRINDDLGHEAGDTVLIEVATRIKASLRRSDTVARLGGDELAVILSQCSGIEAVESLGNKLIERICEPVAIAGNRISVGVAVGAALFPDHGRTYEDVLKCADEAMYVAKASGKAICVSLPAAAGNQGPSRVAETGR